MELLASGRTAEVFAISDDRALKLDRPEWNGVSHYEAGVVSALHAAGLPVPEVFETVEVDGRCGVVLERLHGPTLGEVVAASDDVGTLAEVFVELHLRLQATALAGLPGLVGRLHDELERSGLEDGVRAELHDGLVTLAHGAPDQVCHYDFHPDNVVVTAAGWVVLDWLTAANGPATADLARTLLLRANATEPQMVKFMAAVHELAQDRRGVSDDELLLWTRIVAGARLAEGFEGTEAAWLRTVAAGDTGHA